IVFRRVRCVVSFRVTPIHCTHYGLDSSIINSLIMGRNKYFITSEMTYLKLRADGRNWVDYKYETIIHMCAQGVRDHLFGLVSPPEELVVHKNELYKASDTKFEVPLDRHDEATKTILEMNNEYWKGEGVGTLILIKTVPREVYVFVRNKPTLCERWKALCELHHDERLGCGFYDP
ncbi:hypothetical protein CVT24_012761, partial [Panaeolus cyanescens]